MNFFNAMTVKRRIQLMIAIPTLAILILVGKAVSSSVSYNNNMSDMLVALHFVNHVVPVMSDLVEEQAHTSSYIYGEDKNTLKQRMLEARQVTDAGINKLNDFITQNRDVMIEILGGEQSLNELNKRIGTLKYIRLVADECKPNSDDYKNEFYGQTIWAAVDISRLAEALSDTVSYATAYASHDSEVVNAANAYYWILKTQMATMSLHNEINNIVYGGTFPYNFGQVMHTRSQVISYSTAFRSYANSDLKEIYNKALKDTGLEDTVSGVYWKAFDSYQLLGKEDPKLNPGLDWGALSKQVESAYKNVTSQCLAYLLNLGEKKKSDSEFSLWAYIISAIALIVVVELCAMLILNSVISNLTHSQDIMDTLADEKDMTMRIDEKGRNELSAMASSFNRLVKSFNDALISVKERVGTAKNSVTEGVSKMSETHDACSEQQSSTDTISAAMHQMSTNIGEVSKVAQDAADGVKVAHDFSIDSENNWNQCRTALENLTVGLKSASDSVVELNTETERISGILDIIQGIAEQTNLLALNAAIEAARAGETGKGFAVVADEVRNLAMKSKDSTQQIRAQIDKLVEGANYANKSMELLLKDGESSVNMVISAADSFTQIRSELDKITDLTSVLASSAEEQASVSTHITERIVSIKDASTAIQASAHETAETLEKLSNEFNALEEVVEQFKVEE
ncbi:MAG: methyl-accepting chemotaxis protein [Succinivibrio sp.]